MSLQPDQDFTQPSRPRAPAIVFTATIFLSAALLFFVQPLFARIVLPILGGAPAVWTTAMLFFQSVLIGGYLYAHVMIRFVPARAQLGIHLFFWLLALWFLPLGLPDGWSPNPTTGAALQALGLFAVGVGVPFAVLSANAPLLQAWYARSGGPSAQDPYFLYAASNAGSLLALLAFPLLAEPLFGATAIGHGFAIGFVCLGVGLLTSGLLARPGRTNEAPSSIEGSPISLSRIAYWLVLAFVPSSLMLAVTTKISTDIGSLPLVWVIPLALYLLTFVIVFRARRFLTNRVLRFIGFAGVAWLGYVFSGFAPVHLSVFHGVALIGAFFAVALFAHGALYDDRPDGSKLTVFYLVMSVGGAIGGLFNSLIGPALFDTLVEGIVTTVVAAGVLLPRRVYPRGRERTELVLFLCAGAFALFLAVNILGFDGRRIVLILTLALALCTLPLFKLRPAPTLIATSLVLLVGLFSLPKDALFEERSFFGTHRIVDEGDFRRYVNGTTVHGIQRISELDADRPVPMSYYHPDGPLALALKRLPRRETARVGVVGLGTGAMACHALPEQSWEFYEIDIVVDRVARDPALFSYLNRCAVDAPTHLGDARQVLAEQTGKTYDILFIDAYSSDAVPVHLTTLEAMELYLNRLSSGGTLVFHISNRYFDIEQALGRLAEAAGLTGYHVVSDGAPDKGDWASEIVILSANPAALSAWQDDPEAVPLTSDGGAAWTDDYANVLGILKGIGG